MFLVLVSIRGFLFIVLGIGFLLFRIYLIRDTDMRVFFLRYFIFKCILGIG